MYKLILGGIDFKTVTCIKRIPDDTIIPVNENNQDYQEYLKWVAEGNTPEPADE